MSHLTAWYTFYAIIGPSAASLTGLMFVVTTLIAGLERRSGEPIAAFSSPTVVHFSAALAVAAIMCAPWHELWHAGLLLGLSGLAGMAYSVVVVRRIRQVAYRPVLEDWLWHTIMPLVSYTALLVAALILPGNPAPALFVVGAAPVLLLFIGIHNAWDTVTYIAVELYPRNNKSQDEQDGSAVQ